MRAIVLLSCLFVVGHGFNTKRLMLDLGRLQLREIKPDLARDLKTTVHDLMNRAQSQLKGSESTEEDEDFVTYILRTARKLTQAQFQAEMGKECGKPDSNEYTEAQAFANDYVFGYKDAIPKLEYASEGCLEAAVNFNMRLRAEILGKEDGVPDICTGEEPWAGKDKFCSEYEGHLGK